VLSVQLQRIVRFFIYTDKTIAVTLKKDYRRGHPHLVIYKIGDDFDYVATVEVLRDTLHSMEPLGIRKDKRKALSVPQHYLNEVLGDTE
jgi:hypothetical protein